MAISMTKITTVRAALQAIAKEGLSTRGLFQLGSAMGPASLYLAGADASVGFQPMRRTDAAGRSWLMAFTVPHPSYLIATTELPVRYQELTGAELLRLATGNGCCLVLEANSPLECRIPPRATESLQVAAGYTETLVSRTPAAAKPVWPPQTHQRPRVGWELIAS
jgi:hypothetical protein